MNGYVLELAGGKIQRSLGNFAQMAIDELNEEQDRKSIVSMRCVFLWRQADEQDAMDAIAFMEGNGCASRKREGDAVDAVRAQYWKP